jgi:hypothetical protein
MDDKDRELSNDKLVAQRDDAVKQADKAEEENKNYRKFFREIVIFGLGALIVGLAVTWAYFVYNNQVNTANRYNEFSTKINGIKEINANMLDRIDQTQEKINTLKVKYLLLEEQYNDLKKLNNNLTLQVNALQK